MHGLCRPPFSAGLSSTSPTASTARSFGLLRRWNQRGKAAASGARLRAMTSALRQPMTADEFLAWEEGQELRHEFDGFAPAAMTGGTFEHDAIQVNLIRALANRLAGTPCRTHGNSIKIEAMGSIRYPDAFVTCGPIPRGSTLLRDPVVIFEVLSQGTARTDRMVRTVNTPRPPRCGATSCWSRARPGPRRSSASARIGSAASWAPTR